MPVFHISRSFRSKVRSNRHTVIAYGTYAAHTDGTFLRHDYSILLHDKSHNYITWRRCHRPLITFEISALKIVVFKEKLDNVNYGADTWSRGRFTQINKNSQKVFYGLKSAANTVKSKCIGYSEVRSVQIKSIYIVSEIISYGARSWLFKITQNVCVRNATTGWKKTTVFLPNISKKGDSSRSFSASAELTRALWPLCVSVCRYAVVIVGRCYTHLRHLTL